MSLFNVSVNIPGFMRYPGHRMNGVPLPGEVLVIEGGEMAVRVLSRQWGRIAALHPLSDETYVELLCERIDAPRPTS